jgi:hypothetical protein
MPLQPLKDTENWPDVGQADDWPEVGKSTVASYQNPTQSTSAIEQRVVDHGGKEAEEKGQVQNAGQTPRKSAYLSISLTTQYANDCASIKQAKKRNGCTYRLKNYKPLLTLNGLKQTIIRTRDGNKNEVVAKGNAPVGVGDVNLNHSPTLG